MDFYLDRRFDTRYLAFKSQRTGHSRHASSLSSPPSLIPFVKSLSSPGPPPASTTPRKYSLQPQQQHSHSRNLSAEAISYPIISRIDSVSTFTPDQEPRPAPLPVSSTGEKTPQQLQQRQKSIDEDRTPTPQQRRTSKTRSPPPPLNLALNGVSNYVNFPRRPSSSSGSTTTVKPRRGSDATKERSELPRGKSGSRLKGLRISDVCRLLSLDCFVTVTDLLLSRSRIDLVHFLSCRFFGRRNFTSPRSTSPFSSSTTSSKPRSPTVSIRRITSNRSSDDFYSNEICRRRSPFRFRTSHNPIRSKLEHGVSRSHSVQRGQSCESESKGSWWRRRSDLSDSSSPETCHSDSNLPIEGARTSSTSFSWSDKFDQYQRERLVERFKGFRKGISRKGRSDGLFEELQQA